MKTSRFFSPLIAVLLAAVAPYALAGSSEPYEKATVDMISVMNRMSSSLDTVKDKASAEAANVKLKAISEEMKAVQARMIKLGQPDAETEAALKTKFDKELSTATTKFSESLTKAMKAGPDVVEVLKDFMSNLQNTKP